MIVIVIIIVIVHSLNVNFSFKIQSVIFLTIVQQKIWMFSHHNPLYTIHTHMYCR